MSLVKINVKDIPAFEFACEAADVVIKGTKVYADKTVIIVSVRQPSQLYELGLMQGKYVKNIAEANEKAVPPPDEPKDVSDIMNEVKEQYTPGIIKGLNSKKK